MHFRNLNARVVALLTLGLTSMSALAQVEQTTLRVDGLACPFCAYGLEKKMMKLEGYKTFKVLINEGKVIVGWRQDKPLDVQAIHTAVKKAGFTLRGMKGSFIGTITKQHNKYFLVLPRPVDQRFYLYELAALEGAEIDHRHENEGTDEVLTNSFRKRLDQVMVQKAAVRLFGSVQGHTEPDKSGAIGVEGLEIVESLATATGLIRLHKAAEGDSEGLRLIELETNRIIKLKPGTQIDRRESFQALMRKAQATADKKQPLRVRIYGESDADESSHLVLRRWEPLGYGAKVTMNVRDLACETCSLGMMRTLSGLDDVMHVEADHQGDLVWVWTLSNTPDTEMLRREIKSAGRKVVGVKTQLAGGNGKQYDR